MKRAGDPVWKLKNVACAMISTLHLVVEEGTKSPLNPILGETLIQKSVNGMMLYCEQTSHHPPISNFLVEGPASNPFKIYGYLEYQVQVQGMFSAVHIKMPGNTFLELPDGTKYQLTNPNSEVQGLMSDTKIWNAIDTVTIKDLTNEYELEITFDAQKEDRPSGFSGMF